MPDVTSVVTRAIGKFTLEDLISALITLVVCLLIVKLVLKLTRRLLSRRKLEERVRRYVLGGMKLLLYTLTAVFTIGALGVDMSSLVALLSVGSLGVTLAAEDILGNVAGGLVILSSHPFALGDYIESGGVGGTVTAINLNHTKLTTPDGYTALLPNKDLAASKVINYTALGRRRITWKITASYNAPTDVVKDACWEAVRATPGILDDPAPTVFLTNFGESGIDYTVYCWALASEFWPLQFALAENLRKAFGEHGVEIPYKHLNVHIQ